MYMQLSLMQVSYLQIAGGWGRIDPVSGLGIPKALYPLLLHSKAVFTLCVILIPLSQKAAGFVM